MQVYSMPHPDTPDVWQRLQMEARPLVVWGMGNGADKLLSAFEKYGLEVADFMASDGFVRGQLFHGKEVLSLAKADEKVAETINGKTIVKEIVIPNKIVNIVVR